MRLALPASMALHVALLAAAWMVVSAAAPSDDQSLEAVAVDIVSLESFVTVAAESVPMSASQTLVSAGSASAVQPSKPTEMLEPAEHEPAEAVPPSSVKPVTAEAVEADALPPVSALAVAEAVDAAPVAAAPVAESVAVTPAVATDAAKPVETTKVAAIEPPPSLDAQEEPEAKPVKEPVKKAAKKTEPKKVKKPAAPVQQGKGGTADADAASSAAAASKASKAGEGNGEVSKYPGLVQRKLRRALRAAEARGEVLVHFVVAQSGDVSSISVVKSSGNPALDKEAIATVRRAAPFPPIPESANRATWTFSMPVDFVKG
ncbi:TonB family protein [Devosia sp.]|uniref:energy transducer TonB family protein n=1 Tax=Devosia sp. TaxID=1871048 RepID=UPI003BAB41EB